MRQYSFATQWRLWAHHTSAPHTLVVDTWRKWQVIFMSSAPFFSECLTLVDGTVRLYQNVDKELPFYGRKIAEQRRSRLRRVGSLISRKSTSCFGRSTPEKNPRLPLDIGFILDPGVLETTPPAANQTPLSTSPSPAPLLKYPNSSYPTRKRTSRNVM